MPVRLARPEQYNTLIDEISSSDLLYIDTEFHAERRYLPNLYLVQVHVSDGTTWLLDPVDDPNVLTSLREPLLSRPWVVHGGRQDMRLLSHALGSLPEQVLDTQIAAGLVDTLYPGGFRDLLHRHIGRTIEKSATLSDWSKRPLHADQIQYAADDVQLLPPLWKALSSKLTSLNRVDIATHACREARDLALAPADPEVAWRRVPFRHNLRPQEGAILQALTAWREELARAHNQPFNAILSDSLLKGLCRQQPGTIERLAADRRIPKSVVQKRGQDIVELIAQAAQRPERAWPTVIPRESAAHIRVGYLHTMIQVLGRKMNFAPNLIAPLVMLEDLAVLPDRSRAAIAQQLGSWRDHLCGDSVHAALIGAIGLVLADDEVLVERCETTGRPD